MNPEKFNTLDDMLANGSAAQTARQAVDTISAMQRPIQAPPMPSPASATRQQLQDRNPSYLLAVNGQQTGPFTIAELRGQLTNGIISTEDYVWRSGMAEWVKIKDCPDIV